ncbi:MAG: tetratricopeptide repeat protein [Xanthomonadales bacterium]|nr:tetratricopeptide repeat protein [Xanthomonadales bacterium]
MSKVGSVFRDLRRRGIFHTAAVYIVGAWVVLQACDVLFPGAGIPDSAIRYVLVGTVLAFPLVMVFGWMYDFSSKGISRTASHGDADQDSLPLGRFDFVLLSVLGLLTLSLFAGVFIKVIGAAGQADSTDRSLPMAANSIAVLPFVNLSDDPANEYFGDGIAEEILNQLANLQSLQVAARTSSFFFKGRNEPVQNIGRQLGVSTVLEGSVRKSGNRIRVTAQLINATDGYHLWSQNFDRTMSDVFAIQEEIARAIANALEVEIQRNESSRLAMPPTDSIDAYDYYLLGRHHRERRNPESLEKSIELFRQALDLDERFALGYSALALSYLYQVYHADMSPERASELAEPLIERSLELDPGLSNVHATRASIRLSLGDYKAAEAGYREALELRPNHYGVWSSLGFALVLQSRLEEADDAYAKARVMDPMNSNLYFNIGALKMLTGHYDEGLDAFGRVARLAPDRAGTDRAVVHWSITYGRYDEAVRWLKRMHQRDPESAAFSAALSGVYDKLGYWSELYRGASHAYEAAPDNMLNLGRLADFYYRTGDHVGFARFVESEYEKVDKLAPSADSPTNQRRYFWHGLLALKDGNTSQAIDDFIDATGGDTGIETAVYDDIWELKHLALALKQNGQDERARTILVKCLDLANGAAEQGWATPAISYRTAQVYALLGDSENALKYLREAVDKGWLVAADLESDLLWSSMRGDSRFQAMVAEVNTELERIRKGLDPVLAELTLSTGAPD